MRYLLDSNVIAAAIKGRLPVVLRLSELKPGDVAIAAVSRVEAETALRVQPRVQVRFGKLLRDFLAQVRVIDFGALESQAAVNLAATLRGEGNSLPPFDLLVAATAIAHQLTLVTDRPMAFASVSNLDVENWLSEPNRISQGTKK
ncbi:MAG TPA: PIN domain-containing protein [Nevskiaceae bacterium]|nr:PIN domain-containing protein [Nevskiaceae bacterium]